MVLYIPQNELNKRNPEWAEWCHNGIVVYFPRDEFLASFCVMMIPSFTY